jgi:hypothetical protein
MSKSARRGRNRRERETPDQSAARRECGRERIRKVNKKNVHNISALLLLYSTTILILHYATCLSPSPFLTQVDLRRFICTKEECPMHNQVFPSKSQLVEHTNTKAHGDAVKQYQCDLCGDEFFRLTQLKEHIAGVHECAFKCQKCGSTFPRKNAMSRHVKRGC